MARLALLLALVLGVGTSVANASEKPVVPKDPKLRGVPHSLKLKGQFVSLPASGSLLNAMPSWIRDSPAFSADAGVWKCLDGNGVIPWEWVNDDYCDCKDGSDEPGTAACAHIQGAKFHCRNARHVPANIDSKLVDDGICDPECCDGSSEKPASPEQHPPCANTCRELAAAAQAAKLALLKVQKAGLEKRKNWEKRYKELKVEKQSLLNNRRGQVEEVRRRVEILRGEKDVAEAIRESARAAASPTQESTTAAPAETEAPAESEAEFKLGEPYAETVEESGDEEAAAAAESGEAAPAEEKKEDEQFFPYPKEYAPPPREAEKPAEEPTKEDLDYNDYPDEEETAAPPPPPAPEVEEELPETKAYNEASEELRKLEEEIRNDETWLERDYGEGGSWSGVEEEGCIQGTFGEYIYELCIHGQATQKASAGGHRIAGLGNFGGFTEGGRKMKWENGDTCWNGPARSVSVNVECGEDVAIETFSEPSKCEYVARVRSPAVCEIKE